MKVIIEMEINSVTDEFNDTYLEEGEITVRTEGLTPEQAYGLAESWGQSDWFYVDFTNTVVDRLGSIA